jgi:hypothetical protein
MSKHCGGRRNLKNYLREDVTVIEIDFNRNPCSSLKSSLISKLVASKVNLQFIERKELLKAFLTRSRPKRHRKAFRSINQRNVNNARNHFDKTGEGKKHEMKTNSRNSSNHFMI